MPVWIAVENQDFTVSCISDAPLEREVGEAIYQGYFVPSDGPPLAIWLADHVPQWARSLIGDDRIKQHRCVVWGKREAIRPLLELTGMKQMYYPAEDDSGFLLLG